MSCKKIKVTIKNRNGEESADLEANIEDDMIFINCYTNRIESGDLISWECEDGNIKNYIVDYALYFDEFNSKGNYHIKVTNLGNEEGYSKIEYEIK